MNGKFTGLKVARIFPLVLLVKESQKQPEFLEVRTVTRWAVDYWSMQHEKEVDHLDLFCICRLHDAKF